MWGSAACCLSSLSFPGRVLQECLGAARTLVLMAGSNVPAPRVTYPEMLCVTVCSPYRLKPHSWNFLAWQRSYSPNAPRTFAARQCFARCPQPFINGPRQPLASGALPETLSLAVTPALRSKQSILPILTGLRSSECCSLAGTGEVWPCPCPACRLPGVLQGLSRESPVGSARPACSSSCRGRQVMYQTDFWIAWGLLLSENPTEFADHKENAVCLISELQSVPSLSPQLYSSPGIYCSFPIWCFNLPFPCLCPSCFLFQSCCSYFCPSCPCQLEWDTCTVLCSEVPLAADHCWLPKERRCPVNTANENAARRLHRSCPFGSAPVARH